MRTGTKLVLCLSASVLFANCVRALRGVVSQECGVASAKGQSFIIDGKDAAVADFPWHAGVYRREGGGGPPQQICGGSLVLPDLIMTAAHCCFDKNEITPAADIKIAVGKYNRDWDVRGEEVTQRRNVSKIHVHPLYRGRTRNFADDIALLELDAPIIVNAYVLPICVDWLNEKLPDLRRDSVGTVVGWGKTAKGSLSPTLQSAELPFIPLEDCVDAVPSTFRPFLTADKFCAGHLNGASVAPGDSGGGLAFSHRGLWYLRGVVSVGVTSAQTYSAFTDVGKFRNWISDVINEVQNQQHQVCGKPSLRWDYFHPSQGANIDRDAVFAGVQVKIMFKQNNPGRHYVGRIFHENNVIPSTVTKYDSWGTWTPWKGKSVHKSSFEVLTADASKVRWVPAANGKVPPEAEPAGVTAEGEALYACRVTDDTKFMTTAGVLQPSMGKCGIEFHGLHYYSVYEVLVIAP